MKKTLKVIAVAFIGVLGIYYCIDGFVAGNEINMAVPGIWMLISAGWMSISFANDIRSDYDKRIQEILKDAEDGVLKDKNRDYLKNNK